MKEEKHEVTLYWDGQAIDDHTTRDIGTLSLRFVTVRKNEGGFDEVRNPSYENETYSDLELHTQWNTERTETYSATCTYGDSVYYKTPYRVGRHEAECMLKMLKRIKQVEAKFPIHPASFGQWVVLLCKGLGIKRLCVVAGNSRGWHNENSHTFHPIAEAQHKIDDAIRDTFPKPEKEAEMQTA